MSASSQKTCRVIAMLNQKGGVGKTTSTVNLGAALAEAGHRVCLLDLDPQAHLTLHLGIEQERISKTVYDLLIDPDCYATDAIISARKNLDAVLSEVDLAAAETELAQTPDRQSILRRKFESLAGSYDYVIIDCPPSLGLLTLNALSLAQEVFVPMQAHFLALQGVGKLLETVGLVCRSINPQLRVSGIVLCMHEQQTTLAKEIVADLDAFFAEAANQDVPWRGCRVLRPAIRRNVKLAEAPSFGKTIFDYEPTCPGAADYRMLAQQVIAQTATPKPVQSISPPRPSPSIKPKQGELPQAVPPRSKPGQSEAPAPARQTGPKPGQSEAPPRIAPASPASPASPAAKPAEKTPKQAIEPKPQPARNVIQAGESRAADSIA